MITKIQDGWQIQNGRQNLYFALALWKRYYFYILTSKKMFYHEDNMEKTFLSH